MTNQNSHTEQLQKKILRQPKHAGLVMDATEQKLAYDFCEGYKTFMDVAKTEREAVTTAIGMLQKAGFQEFDPTKKYIMGDKVYLNNRGKTLLFATIGTKSLDQGVHMIASHVDSPRIDLKQNPLYEDHELALLKTHYYGGVRKYQWVTIPLAMHGVVYKQDGTTIQVTIGEDDSDPVFFMTDLLPHLSQEQNQRKLFEGIKGEELNVLLGSQPYPDDEAKEKVRLNVMNILFEKYGIIEADFQSADLTLVPAGKARDIGIDRSMVGAYGHDDRVCAYPSLMAAMEVKNPEYTSISILTDREEIGSDGNTGLKSRMLEYFLADLAEPYGIPVRRVLSNSKCISADVSPAFDPTFPDVADLRNNAQFGYGISVAKYTGSRGKSDTSECSAEFLGYIRSLMDQNGVLWQTATYGRIDLGGGGTVAKYIANLGVDVLDMGVPVLAMHAPMEVVNKLDVYQTYKAFRAFLATQ